MADMFRRELDRRISCGNPYHGKDRKILRRLARRKVNHIEDFEFEKREKYDYGNWCPDFNCVNYVKNLYK